MSMNVKFLAGTRAQYNAITPVATTFYYLTDENAFYLGSVKLDNADVLALIGTLPEGASTVIGYIDSSVAGLKSELVAADEALEALLKKYTDDAIAGVNTAAGVQEETLKKYTDDAVAALDADVSEAMDEQTAALEKYADDAVAALGIADYAKTADVNAELAKKQDNLVFATAYNAETNKVATVADITAEVAKILNDADPSDIDTLEEIAAWIASHPESVAALNAAIEKNKADIATINGKLPDGTIADTDDVAAAQAAAEATAAAALDAYKGEAATAHKALEDAIAGVKATADAAATQESLDDLSDVVTENKEAADATQTELTTFKGTYADDKAAHDEAYAADKAALEGAIATAQGQADKGVADAATAQAAAEAAQSTADSKTTLDEVKATYIGDTSATLTDVVKAVNQLNDGVVNAEDKLNTISTSVSDVVAQLTWGTIA